MARFIDSPRFPDSVSEDASGGPTFLTNVFTTTTGLEQRSIKWSRCRHRYNVKLGIRTDTDMMTARDLVYNVAGKGVGFRYKDWNDYQLTDEVIGTGDATTTVFEITKTYTAGALSYQRRIFKVVSGTLTVKVNSVAMVEDTDFTINYNTGVITFAAAPANTHAITVTCEFDVPVRLDTDEMDASHVGYLAQEWASIPLIEVTYGEQDFIAAALSLDFQLTDNSQFAATVV